MLKGNRRYIFFLIICLAVLVVLQVITPKPVNWKVSYMRKDKIPYGTSAIYEMLPFLFPRSSVTDVKVPLYNSLNEKTYNNTNYIIINDQFEPDKLDIRQLLDFVKKGNTVFISSNYSSEELQDTLKYGTTVFFDEHMYEPDSVSDKNVYGLQQESKINFYNPLLKDTKGYVSKVMENTYFSSFDTAAVTILGNVNGNKINFIKMPFGKGNFFIHTTPEVFINYNFLDERRSVYAAKVFSHLPVQNVLWDEYYKSGKVRDTSPLRVIMDHKALSTAYFVLLFSILIFIVLGIKRRQRIIPIIEPLRNTTLDFVDTIGTLYYQQGSHKEIAEKHISYFLSFLRSSFRMITTVYDDVFITRLSERSGIEKDKIKNLFNYISYIKAKQSIHEQELLQLNRMIEDFYKLNKR
jgi:hypothetical protein